MWAPSLTRTGLCFTKYNIFTFYMLLHECIYNIYKVSVSPDSVQQIMSYLYSFRLWILMVILLREIWSIFVMANIFSSSDTAPLNSVKLFYYSYYSQHILSRGKLFTFGAPTNWHVGCRLCSCKGTGTFGSIVAGPASTLFKCQLSSR
jgi:hypothetical protein